MEWTEILLYTAIGLMAVVVLCWVLNLVRVARNKETSIWLNRGMYAAALAAVVLNAIRSGVVYEEKTMLVANLVVLVCVVISLVRTEHTHKYGPDEAEDQAED